MTGRSDQTPSDSWFRATFDLIVATTFLSVIGCLFVAFAVLMGKYELLVLAYVLLGAACVRSLLSPEQRQKLERTAVVGEGLKIFNRLEAYYLAQPPRSMLYYLFFPITGIWSFFFSKNRGRYELKAYWGLLQWIIVLLFVGGFGSYMRFYKHFDWQFSITWVYMELLAIYFLCNFFAVPLSATSLRLSLQKKRFRLFATTGISLVVLTGFLFVFAYRTNYDNLIPMNIMLDKRLADFKASVMKPQGPKPLHKSLLQYEDQKPYFARILHTTQTFLAQHAPRILQFNQQYLFAPDTSVRQTFFAHLNKRYQERLAPIATMDEHKQFFLTVTQMPKEFWVLVCIPFRESAFYFFRYKNKRVKLFKFWKSIPSQAQAQLLVSWNQNAFVFSEDKRMAQLVVEFMRDKFQRASENLDMLAPRKKDTANLAQPTEKAKGKRGDVANNTSPPSPPPLPSRAPSYAPSQSTAPQPPGRVPRAAGGTKGRQELGKGRRRAKSKRNIRNIHPKHRNARKGPGLADKPTSKRPLIQWGRARQPAPVAPRPRHDFASQYRGLTLLMGELRKFDREAKRMRRYLQREFGLTPQSRSLPPGEALLAMWPKPWKVKGQDKFHLWLRQVITKDIPRYKRELKNQVRPGRFGRPAPPSTKITQLQQLLRKKESSYKRTRSMYTWSQMRRLKQEIAILRKHPKAAVIPGHMIPAKSATQRKIAANARTLRTQRRRLASTRKSLATEWKQVRHYRRHFSVHSAALVSFDYTRALSAQLLYDHFGKTPALVQTWWTHFYELFLSVIMLLFQVAMPLHILMILFCQLRINEIFPALQVEGEGVSDREGEVGVVEVVAES